MSKTLDWDKIPASQNSAKYEKDENLFMRLPHGDHKIRIVGKPVEVLVAWFPVKNKEGKTVNIKVVVPEDYKERVEANNIKVTKYYAINCFDRADTENGVTRLKILEKGGSIFNSFRKYFDATGIPPGGKDGPDWVISADVPKDRRQTRYSIMPMPNSSPFTKEEKEFLKKDGKDGPLGERGFINLDEYYSDEKAAEELEKLLKKTSSFENMDSVDDIINDGDSDDSDSVPTETEESGTDEQLEELW